MEPPVLPVHDFRHSGWAADRQLVFDAFLDLGVPTHRQDAFRTCGSNLWVIQNGSRPSEFATASNKCHDRFCVPCVTERARRTKRVVQAFIEPKRLRFVTFTLKHQNEGLAPLLDKLLASFKEIRKTKFWQARVTGGVCFFETTWGEKNNWHPHLHCIVEGKFIPEKQLREEWLKITGDSYVVDVRAVKDKGKTAEYVAKYTSKGWNHATLGDRARLKEAIEALHGRRLSTTFGEWRGLKLMGKDNEENWVPLCSWRELQSAANAGDEYAIKMIAHLREPNYYPSPGEPPPRFLLGTITESALPPPPMPQQLPLFDDWHHLREPK